MSELTYKKIVDVEQVETLNDAATVFINDNGAMKQVAADKFGAVKTVNGIEPDENGDVFTEDLADICIVDMTDVIPGKINMNYRNKSYAEIIDMLARGGSNVRGAIVSRVCLLSTGEQPVYTATAYDPYALNKMRIHFGDNLCPVIIDAEANTITLDPDWVAPTSDVTIPSGATLTIEEGATVVDNAGALGRAFVVTFSKDDTGTRSVDKTFAEIENAITSGQVVLAKTTEFEGSDTWLKLDAHSGEYITFTYYMALQYYITYFAFAVNADGTVGFFSQNYLTAESN